MFLFTALLFLAIQTAAPEVTATNWNAVWQFALAGIGTALTNYLRKVKDKESFDWRYLLIYAGVGAGAGIYAALRGKQIDNVWAAIEGGGIILIAFSLLKGGGNTLALVAPAIVKTFTTGTEKPPTDPPK